VFQKVVKLKLLNDNKFFHASGKLEEIGEERSLREDASDDEEANLSNNKHGV
jgi:hypothetical protein